MFVIHCYTDIFLRSLDWIVAFFYRSGGDAGVRCGTDIFTFLGVDVNIIMVVLFPQLGDKLSILFP